MSAFGICTSTKIMTARSLRVDCKYQIRGRNQKTYNDILKLTPKVWEH